MVRYRPFLPALAALAVALFITWRTPPQRELKPPFHGIALDPVAVAKIREVWSREKGRDLDRDLLRQRATAVGEPASRALVEILVTHYATTTWDRWKDPDADDESEPEAILIGELATEATARVLARAVADRRLPWGLRRALVVALCRERLGFAADALARIACDRREHPRMRRAILLRFHRLGCAAPAPIKELLYQPFDNMDVLAAATLAMCGDPEAPSLLLAELSSRTHLDGETWEHCARAVQRIVRRPLDLPMAWETTERWSSPDTTEERGMHSTSDTNGAAARLVAVLRESMGARADTAFERERKEYLAGDRRRREMAARSFEEIIAAGDDFDLAAASLRLTSESEEEVGTALERLHRLCLLCERRLAGVTDTEARIGVLNSLLASVGPSERDTKHASHLPLLLAEDEGNCLARSTLYLAVAERLALPLQAHAPPRHVYVAWEEGGRRRNIETTDDGRTRPDDGRRLTKRQVLSLHLSNRAWALHDAEAFAQCVTFADRALALDPSNPAAYLVRARAIWNVDLDADPRPDCDRAAEIQPGQASHWVVSSEMALELGFPRDALRRAEEASGFDASADAAAMQARAHLALGDAPRAREIVEEAATRWPNSGGALAFVRFELSLDREGHAPLDRDDISVAWKVRALLGKPSPNRAWALLDGARDQFQRRRDFEIEADEARVATYRRGRREFHLLEAQVLAKLGRMDEAREALRVAEEAAPPVRETLEVRRLLETGR